MPPGSGFSFALNDLNRIVCANGGTPDADVSNIPLKDVSSWALDNTPVACSDKEDHIHLYTDGSHDPDKGAGAQCGWTFVALEQEVLFEHSYKFIGVSGGPCLDFDGLQDSGLLTPSSGGAKLVAILQALLWSAVSNVKQALIHYDCIPIGDFIFGRCFSIQSDLRDLGLLARELLHFLRAKGKVIDGVHIYGHDEQPWNELADVVAKYSSRNHCSIGFRGTLE